MQLLASEVSEDYYTRLPGILNLLMLTITYIQAMILHIHTQGRFTNHTVRSLDRIVVMATSVEGVMAMGNIVLQSGKSNPHLWHSRPVCYHYTT